MKKITYLLTLASSAMWAQETYPAVYYYYIQEKEAGISFFSDGHKKYVTLNSESSYALQSLSPNPANSQVQIHYQVEGATSSYISVTSVQNAVSNNYILNVSDCNLYTDVTTYTSRIYVVTFYCDGESVESKTLVMQ